LAYEEFLKRYPQEEFAEEERAEIFKLYFELAKKIDAISIYNSSVVFCS
jgi:hypothetical protein